MPSYVLHTVTHPGPRPTLDEVRRTLGLAAHEVDAGYGLHLVDPDAGQYALKISPDAVARVRGRATSRDACVDGGAPPPNGGLRGPYSDDVIEPFGPPQDRTPPGYAD